MQEHLSPASEKRTPEAGRRIVREDIEWCDVWIPHLNQDHLPRVLLIGDSITRAYYPDVGERLRDRAFVGRLTTSRSVGDPALIVEVNSVLGQTSFEVIHFNNGMHGWGYTEEEYETYFPEFVEAIRSCAPKARLIWASTTPVRVEGNLSEFDARNERVKVRNACAAHYVQTQNIPVNDLFSLAAIEHYSPDGVHFNESGAAIQAEQVAAAISKEI